jgi:hypothetical protein
VADRKPAGLWKENEMDVHEYHAKELLANFGGWVTSGTRPKLAC